MAISALVAVILNVALANAAADHGVNCSTFEQSIIVLQTPEGTIEIEVFPEVAPEAVEQLLRLVQGPIFCGGALATEAEREPVGYFDGLLFDFARPGAELATSIRPPRDAILIRTQIDAIALGLDDIRVQSTGDAMNVWQHEILPYRSSILGRHEPHPRLAEWWEQWQEDMRPDFLLGVSQKEINEALGYTYESGLPSLPVRSGSVGLAPASKEWSTPGIVISLKDRPLLDGRRMIIGKVISGLGLADDISRRKLTPIKSARNRPLVPVRITNGRLECRPASKDDET